MTGGSIGAGYLAGVLSTLSPCVLPLLPLVVGSALAAHRVGALVLAAGLALSFTIDRSVRRHCRVRDRAGWRCVPHRLRRAVDGDRPGVAERRTAGPVCRGDGRSGGCRQPLAHPAVAAWFGRPVRGGGGARCGLESLCRADAGCGLGAGGAGAGFGRGGGRHVGVRPGRVHAFAAGLVSLSRRAAPLARADGAGRAGWQDGTGRRRRRGLAADPDRAGSVAGGSAGDGVAGLADGSDDAVFNAGGQQSLPKERAFYSSPSPSGRGAG